MTKLLKHYENAGDPHENRTNTDMETVCFVGYQFWTELFASASFFCILRLCLERRMHWVVFKIKSRLADGVCVRHRRISPHFLASTDNVYAHTADPPQGRLR
jgi:hypothetical protein